MSPNRVGPIQESGKYEKKGRKIFVYWKFCVNLHAFLQSTGKSPHIERVIRVMAN